MTKRVMLFTYQYEFSLYSTSFYISYFRNDVRLQQRIEYLSRAIMCAKSSTTHISSAADGEFLHELEEKMEVARLQLQVQKALSKLSSSRMECQEALNRLDSDLLDLTIVSALFTCG